jgi:DNA-directed RNA polymerase specialized sigma24 family protein
MPPRSNPGDELSERAAILAQVMHCGGRTSLLRIARLNSSRSQDAEDALSEAGVQFLRFYHGPPGARALNWMKLVTKRCAWEIKHRAQVRESPVRIEVTDELPTTRYPSITVADDRPGPEQRALRAEEVVGVRRIIGALKPDERIALLLFGLGYSYSEISQMQGWTMTKVTRCIEEGRAAFRKMSARGGNS